MKSYGAFSHIAGVWVVWRAVPQLSLRLCGLADLLAVPPRIMTPLRPPDGWIAVSWSDHCVIGQLDELQQVGTCLMPDCYTLLLLTWFVSSVDFIRSNQAQNSRKGLNPACALDNNTESFESQNCGRLYRTLTSG